MNYQRLSNIILFALVVSFTSTYTIKRTFFLDEIISVRAAQNQQEKLYVDSLENRWVNFDFLNKLIFKENHSFKEITEDIYNNYISATDFPHTNLYHSVLRIFLGVFGFQGVKGYFFGMFLFQFLILLLLVRECIKFINLSLGLQKNFSVESDQRGMFENSTFSSRLMLIVTLSIFFASSDVISNFMLSRQYWFTLFVSLIHFNFIFRNFEKLIVISDYRRNLLLWSKFLFLSSILIITIYGAILWFIGLILILYVRDILNDNSSLNSLVRITGMWLIFFCFLTLCVFLLFPAYNLFNGRVGEALVNLFHFNKLYYKLYRVKHILIFFGNPHVLLFFPIVLYFFIRDLIKKNLFNVSFFLYSSSVLFFLVVCFNLFVSPISTLRYAYPPLQLLYLLLITTIMLTAYNIVRNKIVLNLVLIVVFFFSIYKLVSVNIAGNNYFQDKIEYTENKKFNHYQSLFGSLKGGKTIKVKVDLKNDFEIMHLMGMNFNNVELFISRGESIIRTNHDILLTSFKDKKYCKETHLPVGQVNCFQIYRLVNK